MTTLDPREVSPFIAPLSQFRSFERLITAGAFEVRAESIKRWILVSFCVPKTERTRTIAAQVVIGPHAPPTGLRVISEIPAPDCWVRFNWNAPEASRTIPLHASFFDILREAAGGSRHGNLLEVVCVCGDHREQNLGKGWTRGAGVFGQCSRRDCPWLIDQKHAGQSPLCPEHRRPYVAATEQVAETVPGADPESLFADPNWRAYITRSPIGDEDGGTGPGGGP